MEKYNSIAREIRKNCFLAALMADSAHLASSFSIVEILVALYFGDVLNIDEKSPNDKTRDYFYLSKGHGALSLYSTLCLRGFFTKDVLCSFSTKNSILGGEPDVNLVPGVEATTGSLGQGLSLACGAAFASKLDNKKNKFFCLVGDGECQEGAIWEAILFAKAQNLNNLTLIVDCNSLQKMNKVEKVIGFENWKQKFNAFGFETFEVDGHDVTQLINVFNLQNNSGKPRVVIAKTIKGKGVSTMENSVVWHYKMPGAKTISVFLNELGISQKEYYECKKHI